MDFERLEGDAPDVVGYLIRRDGPSWLKEIGGEIDNAQRLARETRGEKKKARTFVALAALHCTKRDRLMAVIVRGYF